MRRFTARTSRRLALGLALLITATVSAQNPRPSPAVPTVNETDPGKQQDSQRQFDLAIQLAAQGKYADAEKGFEAALTLDPQNTAADEAFKKSRQFTALHSEALDLARRSDILTARERLIDARRLDGARFEREGLAIVLERLTRQTGQEHDKNALRDALVALTRGDTQKSISILEPVLARRSGHDASVAALRAYLGVAYATQALASPKQDEPARLLREKALAQFRLAVAAQPDYQLSSRLVSPKIVALFQQARTNP